MAEVARSLVSDIKRDILFGGTEGGYTNCRNNYRSSTFGSLWLDSGQVGNELLPRAHVSTVGI